MVVILNASAGACAPEATEDLKTRLSDLFAAAGISIEVVTADGGAMTDATKRAAEHNGTVVAAGGDGTISAIAAALAGTDSTLGVLPLGTLNHFAQDLNIPLDLDAAVRTVAGGHRTIVDLAEVNGRVFVNNSSLGIYPQIVRHREAQQARLGRGKWPAFVWAALLALRRLPFLRLRIVIEGKALHRQTAFLFIGNNEYDVTGFRLGGRQRVDSGKLWLYLAHRVGRWGLFRLAVRALLGHLSQEKDFEAYCVDEAFIETRRRSLLVATDGEVNRLDTPLHYRSRPGALRVIVPRDSTA